VTSVKDDKACYASKTASGIAIDNWKEISCPSVWVGYSGRCTAADWIVRAGVGDAITDDTSVLEGAIDEWRADGKVGDNIAVVEARTIRYTKKTERRCYGNKNAAGTWNGSLYLA
jgi:hypothetical protein